MKKYRHSKSFQLESGEAIENLEIAYHTYGTLNDKKDNAIWVCHALTANSDVADWWPHTVEEGCFLDPSKYFVICANIPGSCYGSTGPLSQNPATGNPYYDQFPAMTMRDIAGALSLLADSLQIKEIYALIGSSVGGFQALEWLCEQPWRFRNAVLIATAAEATPWAIAIDETQRMAIFADKSYGEQREDAAQAGLAAARAIGLLTYRGGEGYNLTQRDAVSDNLPLTHRACTYQQYQGKKLVDRFNAYSYVHILNAFDTHNVGRGRGGIDNALSKVTSRTKVIGITTDMIFPPSEMQILASQIPGAEYTELSSSFGHDGFLVEHEALNKILNTFLHNNDNEQN